MSGSRFGRVEVRELRQLLSDRDLAVVSQLAELRLMSGRQIEAVHFPPELHGTAATAARQCRRVLARLVRDRLLVRLPRPVGGIRAGSQAFIYALGPVGYRLLQEDGSRLRVHEPGTAFVDHQLAVSQLVVDLTLAGRSDQLELVTLEGEPACWRTLPSIGRAVLRPDLFLAIGAGDLEYRWFVEVDRGTHRNPALLRKARLYESYYQSGVEQATHGIFPRVAWITPDQDRAAQAQDNIRRWRVHGRVDARYGQRRRSWPAGWGYGVSGLARNRILLGDIRDRLSDLPNGSIDCVITSPPYFQLRDYGIRGQIGLETTVGGWVDELRLALERSRSRAQAERIAVAQCRRHLLARTSSSARHRRVCCWHPSGCCWRSARTAGSFATRSIWAKTNPMPHSVGDRLTNSYDVVYFLTRSPSYWFDLDAIRLPHRSSTTARRGGVYPPDRASAPLWRQHGGGNRGLAAQKARGEVGHQLGKNPGDVWPLPSANFGGQHFATFPPGLVERPLLATCPELICDGCGTPFQRVSRIRHEERGRGRPQRREARVLRYSRNYSVIRERGPLAVGMQVRDHGAARRGARSVLRGRNRRPGR